MILVDTSVWIDFFAGRDLPHVLTLEQLILDNEDIKVTKIGNEVEFILKNKEALKKYQDYLFFGTTNAITTECGHTFCGDCLNTWRNQHHNCPICRADL